MLSAALLVGLAANAVLGWWWADPLAGLVIATVAGLMAYRTMSAEALADTCCAPLDLAAPAAPPEADRSQPERGW